MNRQVKVSREFFAKSKNEYSNWVQAFIRELVQNSYDANATRMTFTIVEEDGFIIITCLDNGKGMDESTLLNVFLSLGGSTKHLVEGDDSTVGGMGYAKVVICMAHESYQIRTQDNVINGSGGDYGLTKTSDIVEGAEFTVKIKCEDWINAAKFERHLDSLVNKSELRQDFEIYLNGEKVIKEVINYPFSFISPIGKVQFKDVTDGSDRSELWVRVKGLPMFNHSSYNSGGSSFVGILELDGHPLEYLTANRDGLKRQHARTLNDVFQKLATERTALKCHNLIDMKFNKVFESLQNTQEESCSVAHVSSPLAALAASGGLIGKDDPEQGEEFNPFKSLIQNAEKKSKTILDRLESVDSVAYPKNFSIFTENVSSTKSYTQIVNVLKKVGSARLAHQWKAAVMGVLASNYMKCNFVTVTDPINGQILNAEDFENSPEVYANRHNTPIYTGFVFNDQVEGINASRKDEHIIAINPTKLSEDWTFEDLVDVAQHEVAHFIRDYHCDDFCAAHIEVIRSTRRTVPARIMEKTAKKWFKAAKNS